jgi:tetratricopeptide (TPR) repeat protein
MQQVIARISQLLSQGKALKAEQELHILLLKDPHNEDLQAMLGHTLLKQNKSNEAIKVFQQLTHKSPTSANAYSELANALLSSGKTVEAEQAFKKAVSLDPTYSDAWHFLGNLLIQRKEIIEAQQCFAQSEVHDPFRQHFVQVKELLEQNKFHDAEKITREVLSYHPNHPQALHIMATLAQQSQAYEEAIKILSLALKYSPFHVSLWELIAKNFAHLGFFEQAINAANNVVKYAPTNANSFMLLATELANAAKFEQSLTELDNAIRLTPNVANIHIQRGHVLKTLGQRKLCEQAYKTSIALEKINGTAYWALADLKSYHFNQSEQADIKALFNNKNVAKSQASQAGFALAKHYEDEQNYDEAFHCYQKANNLRPDTYYNAKEYQNSCDLVKQYFSKDTLLNQATALSNSSKATPIFIVGLTRSGSTLIEQILASHSKIEGTMELYSLPRVVRKIERLAKRKGTNYPAVMSSLSIEELKELGQHYLQETAIFRTNKPYFIDKMPPNFHNVGLIKMILPNAIIIDARRHPISTGFSNYKQHFARGYDFSYRLKDIGHYYNCYLSLMDYWDEVLPKQVHRIQYEDMVQNTAVQVRQLLSHCGVEFEPSCLEFYKNKRAVRTASSEQVRQPISSKGMQQWLHFEQYLTPLKEALGSKTLKRFEQWL